MSGVAVGLIFIISAFGFLLAVAILRWVLGVEKREKQLSKIIQILEENNKKILL